jgi:selenide,water dikinase
MYYGLISYRNDSSKRYIRNNTPKIGHVLVLTKPLGMGILSTAIKRDLIPCKSI